MTHETVTSGAELVDAIREHGAGDVIDATAVSHVDVPEGTTLEGDGVVVRIEEAVGTIFEQRSPDVTFRGIEFEGHRVEEIRESGYWDYPDDDSAWDHDSGAIHVYSSSCVVEDCTFAGFTHAAVRLGELSGGTMWTPTIRNCTIRDNNAKGLGYGVCVYSGYPVIEWCYFQNNRHDIAGGGDPETCGYEARYNRLGDVGRIYGMEMHPDGGKSVHVHHNTFEHKVHMTTGEDRILVQNRGVPAEPEHCEVHHNWFENPDRDAVIADNADDHYTFYDNHFGTDEPPSGVGRPRDAPADRYSLPHERLREIHRLLENSSS